MLQRLQAHPRQYNHFRSGTETVKSLKLNTTISLPGELMPYEAIDVYTKETGFVKSIKVDRGSRGKEGEHIAQLDAPKLAAQRAHANAAYQSAEFQFAAAQTKLSADQSST
jgi:membrane fusion protein (multidrug efflux system)